MKVLVSSCLIGINCKYNGKNNYSEKLMAYLKDKEVFAVCPEISAGLNAPRNPAEIVNGIVFDNKGNNLDCEYRKGAETCLEIALKNQVEIAILQSRSPTCGVGKIYDGTFSGKLIEGYGVFAKMLVENGIKVIDISKL